MSASAPSVSPPASRSAFAVAPNRWIRNPWWDQLFIVATPLLIAPILLFLASPRVGVHSGTIAMIVTAFFALGHHLPGMMRAYGDQELFARFRTRFVVTPIAFILISVPLYRYHYEVFPMILYFWGAWHGFMQLYGFVRIYDAKVGSTAPITVWFDWLMCLCWFPTALLFSYDKTADLLTFWYTYGGPEVSPATLELVRTGCLSVSLMVLGAFSLNFVYQAFRGHPCNPIKLLVLASGIGFWWFSIVYVQFSGLSVTLFEIAHDVQYVAITWLYNCRRVNSHAEFDGFMKFVFRRGMALLYLGLIAAYGAIGMIPALVKDGSVFAFFHGFVLISTIMHFYYDGFIWKVRDKSTQAGLGVGQVTGSLRARQEGVSGLAHFLKWSPAIVFVGWLFISDLSEASLTPATKVELRAQYEQQILNATALPQGEVAQSWLFAQFDQAQKIAAAVPGDADSQLRAAIFLANFGRKGEAVDLLEKLLERQPALANARQMLGEIELQQGNIRAATASFQAALSHARTKKERTNANLKLCEVYLHEKRPDLAKDRFDEVVRDNPQVEASIEALRSRIQATGPAP